MLSLLCIFLRSDCTAYELSISSVEVIVLIIPCGDAEKWPSCNIIKSEPYLSSSKLLKNAFWKRRSLHILKNGRWKNQYPKWIVAHHNGLINLINISSYFVTAIFQGNFWNFFKVWTCWSCANICQTNIFCCRKVNNNVKNYICFHLISKLVAVYR